MCEWPKHSLLPRTCLYCTLQTNPRPLSNAIFFANGRALLLAKPQGFPPVPHIIWKLLSSQQALGGGAGPLNPGGQNFKGDGRLQWEGEGRTVEFHKQSFVCLLWTQLNVFFTKSIRISISVCSVHYNQFQLLGTTTFHNAKEQHAGRRGSQRDVELD